MIRDPYNGVGLSQRINDRLWTYWWYTKHNLSGTTPYRFDTIDHPRQKGVTIGYRMTPLDTFILTFDKDLDTQEVADRDITWVRDLHSFVASITWKSVTREWDLRVVAKDF
jgi:LPS-assembly protein